MQCHKWFTRLVVAAAIIDALDEMKLDDRTLDAAKRRELGDARGLLPTEKKPAETALRVRGRSATIRTLMERFIS